MRFEIPVARALPALLACAYASSAHAAEGPGVDCAHATSRVNRTICASPQLSALDRQLDDHYRVLLGLSGADAPTLQREQAQWLREVRNPCPDAACIEQAYAVWDALLVARSHRLAGAAGHPVDLPAAAGMAGAAPTPAVRPPAPRPVTTASPGPAMAAETQPFAADPVLLADARALRGQACASGEDVPRGAGFVPVPGALPVVAGDSVVLVRRHVDADFAILLDTRRGACRMVDAVALPPHAQVGNLLQCMLPADDGSAAPRSVGVGLRRPGQPTPLAYWEVDVAHGRFVRQALDALGWTASMRCREPELGD